MQGHRRQHRNAASARAQPLLQSFYNLYQVATASILMTDNANIYHRFAARFAASAVAVETPDGASYRYADVEALSAQAANVLVGLGLKPGDRVSVVAEKSLDYLWLYLGCLRAGCVFHPLNPAYTSSELKFFLADAGTRVLVYDAKLGARVVPTADACPDIQQRLTLAGVDGDFATLMAAAGAEFSTTFRRGTDNAALLYSSGTTGTPKGICITHDNLYRNADALAKTWAFSADDVLLHALPVFHVHGLFIILGPALLTGVKIRWLPAFAAPEVLRTLPGATIFAGVPTYYARLLAEPTFNAAACSTIRVFISGSAPLPEATFHAFSERTGHTILERYGMTETGINTSNPLHGERKPGSVGPVLPGVEVRVVGAAGSALERHEIGAIQVRGANVFPAYWQLPQATSAAFNDDGWFDTGDQGFFDDMAYLFIVGRSKDMIISGGLNVYPKEIERELEQLDGVVEAAVFGVAHDDFGEAVVAAVVVRPGSVVDEANVITQLKANLAGFKVPKRLIVLEDLPRNAMGKVQKNKLRETFSTLFKV
jgi:malonyl-CoA/methylmalonyl-CoA synthetase